MLQESKLASWSMATTLEFLVQQLLDTEKLTTPVNPARNHDCIGAPVDFLFSTNQERILGNPGAPHPEHRAAVIANLTGGLAPTWWQYHSADKTNLLWKILTHPVAFQGKLAQESSVASRHWGTLVRWHSGGLRSVSSADTVIEVVA